MRASIAKPVAKAVRAKSGSLDAQVIHGAVVAWSNASALAVRAACVRAVCVRAACALALLLALVAACLPCGPAFADGDDNVVNEQQLPDSSFIYDTSIFTLVGADAYYDNQTVQVVGEVVGDAVNADLAASHKWLTLFEKDEKTGATATIATYVTSDVAERVDTFGAYGKTGTTLQVRGTFHLVCQEHEGISDLHAENVVVVKKGSAHVDELDASAFIPGAVCLGIGLLAMLVFYRMRERRR